MNSRIAAAIDVGTNSIKIIVGQLEADGSVRPVGQAIRHPRIGEGLDATGVISPEASDRALEAIAQLVSVAREENAENIRLVATAALREAGNSERFVDLVRERLGMRLEILSEQDECRFSYLAVALDPVLGSYPGDQVTVDVGGASTELTLGRGDCIGSCKSIKLGAVRLHERFLTDDPPPAGRVSEACEYAENALSSAKLGVYSRVVAIGGSVVNMARVIQRLPPERTQEVHGTVVTAEDMAGLVNMAARMTVAQRKSFVGLDPERADITLAGAIIFDRLLHVLGASGLVVCTTGLRQGILYAMLREDS